MKKNLMKRSMKSVSLGLLAGGLVVAGSSSLAMGDELIMTFEGLVAEYTGPSEIDPINTLFVDDLANLGHNHRLRFDGQFIVKNFDPNFTGTFSFVPGVTSSSDIEFSLHAPVLERIEHFTTRIGSNSPNGHAQSTKILLPRTVNSTTTDEDGLISSGFFGAGSLTVENGVPTSISYSVGRDVLASYDSRFDALGLAGAGFGLKQIALSGSNVELVATYDLDTPGAADDAPYGFNSNLDAGVNPSSTILQTTRGIIQDELDAPFAGGGAGNLLDNHEAAGGLPITFDPLDGTGILYHYNVSDVTASVQGIPEPSSFAVISLAGAVVVGCRRWRSCGLEL